MARHKSIERPPAGRTVRIELGGQSYEGTYTLDGPMVTVQTLTLGVKSARLGDSPPELFAKGVLAELVFESERRFRMRLRSLQSPGE
jgi:hypothetical protein